MNQRQKILDLLSTALTAVLLSWSLTMMIAGSLQLSAPPQLALLVCAAVALLVTVGLWSRWATIASAAVSVVGLGVIALSPLRPLSHLASLVGTFVAFSSGEAAMLSDHSATIAILLAALLTLVLHWMIRMQGGVYPALTLSMIVIMACWLVDKQLSGLYIVLSVAALGTMFARSPDDRMPHVRALPAALLAAVLAFLLVPAGNPTWAPLKDGADRVRQLFNDYFMFTGTRITYSLYADGFQPQGEPLGGPADPSEGAVMLVESDSPLLLRGSIKRTYTTYSWTNSTVNSRYLFVDPTKRSVRDQVFDTARLLEFSSSDAFSVASAKVTMLSSGISTLFVPHRLQDLSAGVDNAIYYNTAGEVFITRGVQPGDSYNFTALVKSGSQQSVDQLIRAASVLDDPQYDAAMRDYTALPRNIEGGVYELVERLAGGDLTPYEKAIRIQNHLMSSYTYSLDVPYPPSNRDFVSFFLLTDKKGYCSYFATAMAVMGRMAGLPTRYIEGYMVKDSGPEGTVVTGRNAHAWVEVYFKGVGWVSFNPTPGDEQGDGSAAGAQDPGGTEQDDPFEGEEEQQEEEQPEPEPTEQPADEQEEAPDEAEAEQEQEEEPEPEPQPEDSEQPEPEDQPNDSNQPIWLYILLVLAALGAAVLLVRDRILQSDPRRMEQDIEGAPERLAAWYRALLLVLSMQGQAPSPSESPVQFAERLIDMKLADDNLRQIARALSKDRYANIGPGPAAFTAAAKAYTKQVESLKLSERAKWYWRRFRHGIGDINQIP